MLRACRYYGATPDYWWEHLTWPQYVEMEWQLAEDPPVDRFAKLYFLGHKWWEQPQRPAERAGSGVDAGETVEWDSGLPDYTE